MADQALQLWNPTTGQPLGPELWHQDDIRTMDLSRDERWVATGSEDYFAKIWDRRTGRMVGVPLQHQGWVVAMAFSPDGDLLATGSTDGQVRLWQVPGGEPVGPALKLDEPPRFLAFGDSGQCLILGLRRACRRWDLTLPVPVIAKEVGWGFSVEDARLLAEAGVAAIDVAGAGGTSWSQVEMYRAQTESQKRLAAAFLDWGIPTAEAILNVRRAAPGLTVLASGGLRTGLDIAKSIALGASLGGMAGPFLKAAAESVEMTTQTIEEVKREIRVCMFAAGAGSIEQLQKTRLVER
ncbi:MAG: hypothetical protein HC806_03590 [Anaerolineae bacterium]|nr:hypothetical protein [Anaerolineae bacterium]